MPLDTSTYALAQLRLDGRRWNEFRRINGQMSTQAAADGSSYLEMGNTKVLCTVTGPYESKRAGPREQSQDCKLEVEISIAGFANVDRKKQSRTDKRTIELSHLIQQTFSSTLLLHIHPHSTITLNLHVLSSDGSLLACLINASTLALVDAGIPMPDYIVSCTAGSTGSYASNDEDADPLLDLNGMEEGELPFVTVGVVGGEGGGGDGVGKIVCLTTETRCQVNRLQGMISIATDGCARMRKVLDGIVKDHGQAVI